MEEMVILAIGILAVIVYKISRGKTSLAPNPVVQDDKSAPLAKGLTDYADISNSLHQLRDRELRGLALALQQRGDRIMSYLRQHPKSLPAARHFLNYYQDRTAVLLRQCVTLEQTEVNSPEAQEILCQIKETLHDFVAAYEKQFDKIMNLQLNDMEAELKIARQVLDGDGIEKGAGPQISDEEKTPAKPAEENNWLTPKTVGAAALTILGAVGLYKLFGKQNDKSEK